MTKITILGCGGWGMALAITAFSNGNDVTLWSCFPEEAASLNKTRQNEKLLSGITLPNGIRITSDINEANGSDIIITAVPSFALCETAKRLRNIDFGCLANATKGIDAKTSKRLSVILGETMPSKEIVVLSGPTHAEEVARGIPTAIVAASENESAAEYVQKALSNATFRVYTNKDVIGSELGGAMKNVIAVAAGIIDGLGYGDNTKAALITRGVSEITKLGVAMGADYITFLGLAGIGDLVVTCTSPHSRNHRFGELLGKGVSPEEAKEIVGTVEGYYAAAAAVKLAREQNIEMPICETCYEIIYNGADCKTSLDILMTRPLKSESGR